MKSTLIRIFAIMTLAMSVSAFGWSDKPAKAAKDKSNSANCENTAAPAKAEQHEAKSDNDEEKARQRLIKEQEKQWLHDLQYLGS